MFGWYDNTTWNPWRELQRVQTELDRALQEFATPRAGAQPPIEVWSNEDGYRIRALVSGSAREDLDVSVVEDTLTIRGEVSAQALDEGASWHRRERAAGRFARTLQLPFGVDVNAVQATCKDGVLCIDLPRAASEKPRRIAITTG